MNFGLSPFWMSLAYIILVVLAIKISPLIFIAVWLANFSWGMYYLFHDKYPGETDGFDTFIHIGCTVLPFPVCFYWMVRMLISGELSKQTLAFQRKKAVRLQQKKKKNTDTGILGKINKELNSLYALDKEIDFQLNVYEDGRIEDGKIIREQLRKKSREVNILIRGLETKKEEIYQSNTLKECELPVAQKVEQSKSHYDELIAEANNALTAIKECQEITSS